LTDLIQAITFQRSSGVEAPLPMGRINKENEVRQTWIVTLTDDEIAAGKYFKPSFWKQLAGHARVGDLIEIWNARHTERYILLVQLVEKQRMQMQVVPLDKKLDIAPAVVETTSVNGFSTEFVGGLMPWVVRDPYGNQRPEKFPRAAGGDPVHRRT